MSYVVVIPSHPPKATSLSSVQVDAATGMVRMVADELERLWKEGAPIDDRIRALAGVAEALYKGRRVRVEITAPKREPEILVDPPE